MEKLKVLPVGHKAKIDHCRTFGVSKATYGWVGRRPTKVEMQRVSNAVWKAAGTAKMASPHLRNVVEGGNVKLEMVIASRQLGLAWGRVKGWIDGAVGQAEALWGDMPTGTMTAPPGGSHYRRGSTPSATSTSPGTPPPQPLHHNLINFNINFNINPNLAAAPRQSNPTHFHQADAPPPVDESAD